MILYVLNIVFFSAIFWLVYNFLLKKETFFQANRIYLLVVPVLAAILPFLVFDAFNFTSPDETTLVQIPVSWLSITGNQVAETQKAGISLTQILWIIYGLGACLSFGLFLLKTFKLHKLKNFGKVSFNEGQKIISISDSKIAFSFFNTIFLGENYSENEKHQILLHEKVHVQQKHSWDLFYFELLRIVLWFNPFVYLLQKNTAEVHEFIADQNVSETASKKAYAETLLNAGFGTQQFSFANSFFKHSSLKTRIVMLHKSKSTRISKLKFLMVVPLILAMLTYVSCTTDEDASSAKPSSKTIDMINANMNKGFVLMDIEKDTLVFANKSHWPIQISSVNGETNLLKSIPKEIRDTLSEKTKKSLNRNFLDFPLKKGTVSYKNQNGKKEVIEIKDGETVSDQIGKVINTAIRSANITIPEK